MVNKKIDVDLINQFKEGLEDAKARRIRRVENIKKESCRYSGKMVEYHGNHECR